jgi:hypothetical protein
VRLCVGVFDLRTWEVVSLVVCCVCVCGLQQFDLNSCVLEPWDKLVLGGWICRDRFLYGKVRSMNVCFYSH